MEEDTDLTDWPKRVDRPIALLKLSQSDLSNIVQAELKFGRDGLDAMYYGVVKGFPVPATIYRRPRAPTDEFNLMAHWEQSADAPAVVQSFLEHFSMEQDQLLWAAEIDPATS